MGIRVALIDDQHLVRSGFRMLIDAQPDMVVVGEAGTGIEAVALTGRLADGGDPGVDVVLMDVRMPGMDGVQACAQVLARPVAPRVLMLTTFDLDEYVWAALRAGASGFLLKDARPDELLGAIRSVAAGDAVVAPSATRRLIEQFSHTLPSPTASGPVPDQRLDVLTAREREVLALIATGASNTEIADRLVLAEATVKTHVGRLLAKLDVRDRVGLVVLAYETGLAGTD
ncbi:response regulator transcription factor [Nakamurella sp. YIM 132084]|uniref:Response regulator transcription factor n=1 Tax=Nakamurella leprariae TaxID=2803911 RepID=A0A938YJC9_9ACTN|nr:response regulator transcription factor [Nakamurella leprariae]